MATAILDADREAVRYICMPFEKEPDFSATSVNDDLAALLALGQEPA